MDLRDELSIRAQKNHYDQDPGVPTTKPSTGNAGYSLTNIQDSTEIVHFHTNKDGESSTGNVGYSLTNVQDSVETVHFPTNTDAVPVHDVASQSYSLTDIRDSVEVVAYPSDVEAHSRQNVIDLCKASVVANGVIEFPDSGTPTVFVAIPNEHVSHHNEVVSIVRETLKGNMLYGIVEMEIFKHTEEEKEWDCHLVHDQGIAQCRTVTKDDRQKFRFIYDKFEECCVLTVDIASPQFKEGLGGDIMKIMMLMVLPLKIKIVLQKHGCTGVVEVSNDRYDQELPPEDTEATAARKKKRKHKGHRKTRRNQRRGAGMAKKGETEEPAEYLSQMQQRAEPRALLEERAESPGKTQQHISASGPTSSLLLSVTTPYQITSRDSSSEALSFQTAQAEHSGGNSVDPISSPPLPGPSSPDTTTEPAPQVSSFARSSSSLQPLEPCSAYHLDPFASRRERAATPPSIASPKSDVSQDLAQDPAQGLEEELLRGRSLVRGSDSESEASPTPPNTRNTHQFTNMSGLPKPREPLRKVESALSKMTPAQRRTAAVAVPLPLSAHRPRPFVSVLKEPSDMSSSRAGGEEVTDIQNADGTASITTTKMVMNPLATQFVPDVESAGGGVEWRVVPSKHERKTSDKKRKEQEKGMRPPPKVDVRGSEEKEGPAPIPALNVSAEDEFPGLPKPSPSTSVQQEKKGSGPETSQKAFKELETIQEEPMSNEAEVKEPPKKLTKSQKAKAKKMAKAKSASASLPSAPPLPLLLPPPTFALPSVLLFSSPSSATPAVMENASSSPAAGLPAISGQRISLASRIAETAATSSAAPPAPVAQHWNPANIGPVVEGPAIPVAPQVSIGFVRRDNPPPSMEPRRPSNFKFQLARHSFVCAKADCDKRTNDWDDTSLICLQCGPYSPTRYCSPEHLVEDCGAHFDVCPVAPFKAPAVDMPRRFSVELLPMLPNIYQFTLPERQRQLVFHSMHPARGYGVFSDWLDWKQSGFAPGGIGIMREVKGKLLHIVDFSHDPVKNDTFNRLLHISLFDERTNPAVMFYLARMIRQHLRTRGLWNDDMIQMIAYQFMAEFKVQTIEFFLTSHRDPCFTEWTGERAKTCPDPECRRELVVPWASFGDLTFQRGLEQFCDQFEAKYWILRAWRFTHPTQKDANERVKGVGFEGVPAEQVGKLRARGEGWDGYGNTKNELCS